MGRVLRQRWLWVVALFAAINVAGLWKVASVLGRRTKGLSIESFHPEGRASPVSSVMIRFDQSMARYDELGTPLPEELFSLSPPVAGKLAWLDTRTAAFRPEGKLPLATPFVATVSRRFTSLLGHSLPGDQVYRFHTPPLDARRVRQVGLSHGAEVSLAVEFTDQVLLDEVGRHLELRGADGKVVKFRLDGHTPSRSVRVRTHPYTQDTLTVKLTKGLRGVSGPLGLEDDRVFRVRIDSGLRITDVDAYARRPESIHIWVGTTQRIDPETARDYIQIEPKVDTAITADYGGFKLTGPFQPGTRYRLTFLKGLKGANGTFLARDTVRSVTIPDCEPLLRFKTRGIYLSARGSLLLPLESVNVEKLELTLEKVYANNVVHYLRDVGPGQVPRRRRRRRDTSPSDLSHRLCTKEYRLDGEPNHLAVTHIDLRALLSEALHGVFRATVEDAKRSWRRDCKLILVTDIGLSVKRSESDLLVWVNALSTGEALGGAAVTVFTRSNQTVLTGASDASGIAHFRDVDWSGDRKPYVVTAASGDDTGFVVLDDTLLDHSELDTGGRPYLRSGYEAFLYTDRGIYRPGSTVHLRAIVRGPRHSVPKPFPVQFRITRQDKRHFKTLTAKLSQWGTAEADVELPPYAPTGRYTAQLRLPGAEQAIGSLSFQVEEFVPDRLKVEVEAEDRRYRAGEELAVKVTGSHLFGAPAAGRQAKLRVHYHPVGFAHPDWGGYRFADSSRKFTRRIPTPRTATLDGKGEATFRVRVRDDFRPASALEAVASAAVKEVGGRGVTARVARSVDVYPRYVGLAREREDYATIGAEERILVAVLQPDGKPVQAAELKGEVCRVVWNTVLKQDGQGRLRYVSERQEQRLAELTCSVRDSRGAVPVKPPAYGQYVVRLRDEAGGHSADLRFYCVGEGYVPWAMEKPHRLEMVTDREAYAPGDTACVLIKAPFPGRALVTVEGDRIHLAKTIEMAANTAEFRFPVDVSFGPNVYCSATVIRGVKGDGPGTAHRAYGAVPVPLSGEPHQLKVEVEAPEEARPGGPLRVALRVCDATGAGRPAEVTLAAVDEGICQLTAHETPDPWSFFFAKRRLAVATSDVYALLMPEVERQQVGADSTASGGGPDHDPRLFNPVSVQRVQQVALWRSGIETDEDGRAEVVLDLPDFNGQLRLMAVATGTSEFGAAERPALVKQPLMIRASFPRFLAPGDECTIPVTIFNHTGEKGSVALRAEASGGLEFLSGAPERVEVANGRDATALFHVVAPSIPGPASMQITARLGTEEDTAEVEIAVRPPATLEFVSGSGAVKAGANAAFAKARIELPGGWVPKTDTYALSFASLPTLTLGSSVRYLLRYPYGCIEQTTSTAFPLLYLGELIDLIDPETLRGDEAEHFVQAGIDRVLSMQSYNGGFGCWPGYWEAYPWGSVYATHFLVEAGKAGYDVPKEALDAALGYLRELVGEDADEASRPVKAYACYVLALAGRANGSWTYRLYEEREDLPAYSRFHVAMALALMKERKLVSDFLQGAKLPQVTERRDTGGVLYSSTRESAMLLSAYLDLAHDHPHVPLLVQRLAAATEHDRWVGTQDNAFAIMALGKYARRLGQQKPAFKATVTLDGKPLAAFTHADKVRLTPRGLSGKALEVALEGTGTLYYYWGAEGTPVRPSIAQKDAGLRVRRRFLSRSGAVLDPLRIPHGEVVVVELSIHSDFSVQNVVISDLLPAGFEIENPNLETREQLPWLTDGAGSRLCPDRVERRDDRLIVFADLPSPERRVHRYLVRAVTRGRFALPAVSAFAMYDPAIASIHGAGEVQIVEKP